MSFNRSIRRALVRAQKKLPSPFNPRGVVEAPSHVIEIPPARRGGFGFIVRAHQLADGSWIRYG